MAKNIIKILVFLIAFFSSEITAQKSTSVYRDSISADNSVILTENTDIVKPQNSDTTHYVMTKSPMGALFRSAVIPGLGQVYNEAYWKVPVIWGALGTMAYYWKKNDDNYHKFRSLHRQSATNYNKTYRDFYRDNRDLVALYMGLVYAVNLLDAYIDAHLFDFSVDEDPVTSTPMLQMRLNF